MKVMVLLTVTGGLEMIPKGLVRELKDENQRTSREYPNYCIYKVSQNIEKSSSNLRRLAVSQTPMKDHQLTLVLKTYQEYYICHDPNEKWKKRNSRRNRTTKSGKHKNIWKERKLKVPVNIGNQHHQIGWDEGKNMQRIPQKNEKTSQNHSLQQKFQKWDKYCSTLI